MWNQSANETKHGRAEAVVSELLSRSDQDPRARNTKRDRTNQNKPLLWEGLGCLNNLLLPRGCKFNI